jgi:hypothetical protein
MITEGIKMEVPKLQERNEWAGYERKMLNVAKKYGKVCEALINEVEPDFSIKETTGQLGSFKLQMEVEEAKLMLKDKRDYETNKVSFTGILMCSLGESIEAAIRAEGLFSDWYQKNDYLQIWLKLKDYCVKSVMMDLDDVKYALWHSKQGTRSMDEYILEMENKMKILGDNGEKIEDEDMVLIFIKGLDEERFKEYIAEVRAWKGTKGYPEDYVQAKDKFKLWGGLRGLNGKCEDNTRGKTRKETPIETVMEVKVRKCQRCGGNHYKSECGLSGDVKCTNCGKRGHVSKVCYSKRQVVNSVTIDSLEVIGI